MHETCLCPLPRNLQVTREKDPHQPDRLLHSCHLRREREDDLPTVLRSSGQVEDALGTCGVHALPGSPPSLAPDTHYMQRRSSLDPSRASPTLWIANHPDLK